MGPLTTSGLVLALVLLSAAMGMVLGAKLPASHLTADTKDIIKLTTGLVSTILALVLGLLIGASKSYYDTQNSELIQMSAQAVTLDRLLLHYGPETKPARGMLHAAMSDVLERTWSHDSSGASTLDPASVSQMVLYEAIEQLSPANDIQRSTKAEALNAMNNLGQIRWLMYEQSTSRMPTGLLAVIAFWLGVLFLSFGLFAPRHATMIAGLLLCAFCVAGGIFIIMALYDPYHGLIRISSAPLQAALQHLGR